MESPTIHDLPEHDRPREKLVKFGVQSLTNSELIALLLRTGIRGANVVAMASDLLRRHGSLCELARCSVQDLSRVRGIGRAKATLLVAAFGLGARMAREMAERVPLEGSERIYEFLAPEMARLRTEVTRVVMLDSRLRLIGTADVATGTINEVHVHPREVFREAILCSAYAVVLVHNHPSGDPAPSIADRAATRRMAEAADLLQIRFLDHLIIGLPAEGRRPWFSFREAGML